MHVEESIDLATLTADRKKILLLYSVGILLSILTLAYIWFYTAGSKNAYLLFMIPSIVTASFVALTLGLLLFPYKISVFNNGLYIQGIGLVPWERVQSISYIEMISPPAIPKLEIDLLYDEEIKQKLCVKPSAYFKVFDDKVTIRLTFIIHEYCMNRSPKKFAKLCTSKIFDNLPKFKDNIWPAQTPLKP